VSSLSLGKTGIELLREALAGKLPTTALQATLGFVLAEVSDGFARYELAPREDVHAVALAVHAGVPAMLLDAAMGAAVMTTLDAVTSYTTAMLTVHVTRAITARTVNVLAEGWVVHRGSRLVTAEGRLTDEQGRLLAHGSATCALTERPGAAAGAAKE
jgi:uncharacterized protein (TIGR00369 family)